jgi:ATP-dependent exoDNAse (exonuclease V) alpha subunit
MKNKTNLPSVLRLQVGCRVMFLNNKYIKKQISNGTIGIVIDIDKAEEIVRVAFCINGGIVDVEVKPEPMHFFINERPACGIQYSLQNAFTLTAHKTQSITLLQTSLYLDNQMFAPGQSYVAISRCQFWNDIQILVDERVKEEYVRLEQISNQNLPI